MNARLADFGDLTTQGRATWEAIAELAERIGIDSWAVVGGQMVAIHAALAGTDAPRITDDGDVAVDVRSAGRRAMEVAAAREIALGREARQKHEGDFVFLVSLGTVADLADLDRSQLTPGDRRRLREAIRPILDDPIHPARRFASNFEDAADLVADLLGL